MVFQELTVPARFHGPPTSAHGGWVAGALARRVGLGLPGTGAATVTLRTPPPLRTPMRVEPAGADGTARLVLPGDDRLVAEVGPGALTADPVPAVGSAEAARAADDYRGLVGHPFPTCFVCGPDRAPGDGMRISPGPRPSRRGEPPRTACPWRPDPSLTEAAAGSLRVDGGDGTAARVAPEAVWAALDCPSGWVNDLGDRPMVLGRLTVRLLRAPALGEECVLTGELRGAAGRRTFTASALYGAEEELLAAAEAVWVAVDPAALTD